MLKQEILTFVSSKLVKKPRKATTTKKQKNKNNLGGGGGGECNVILIMGIELDGYKKKCTAQVYKTGIQTTFYELVKGKGNRKTVI